MSSDLLCDPLCCCAFQATPRRCAMSNPNLFALVTGRVARRVAPCSGYPPGVPPSCHRGVGSRSPLRGDRARWALGHPPVQDPPSGGPGRPPSGYPSGVPQGGIPSTPGPRPAGNAPGRSCTGFQIRVTGVPPGTRGKSPGRRSMRGDPRHTCHLTRRIGRYVQGRGPT